MLRKQKGISLIEVMISLVIAAGVAMLAVQAYVDKLRNDAAAIAAGQTATIGQAVGAYISKNGSALSGAAYTTLTVAQLIADNDLPPGYSAITGFGNTGSNGFNIAVRRLGGAAPYQYEALVLTQSAFSDDNATPLSDAAGNGVLANGMVNLGLVYRDTGGTWSVSGGKGAWTVPDANYPGFILKAGPHASVPPGGVGAQIAFLVSPAINANDATYLRVDGGNKMQAALDLNGNNLNNGAVLAGTNVNASGAVVAAGTVTGGSLVSNSTLTTTGNAAIGGAATVANDVSVGGNANVTGSATANLVTATTDVKITSLMTGGHPGGSRGSSSVGDQLGRFAEMGSFAVSDGQTVPRPDCGAGGTPAMYTVTQSVTALPSANSGFQISTSPAAPALPPVGGAWTLYVKDGTGATLMQGASATPQQILVVTRCYF